MAHAARDALRVPSRPAVGSGDDVWRTRRATHCPTMGGVSAEGASEKAGAAGDALGDPRHPAIGRGDNDRKGVTALTHRPAVAVVDAGDAVQSTLYAVRGALRHPGRSAIGGGDDNREVEGRARPGVEADRPAMHGVSAGNVIETSYVRDGVCNPGQPTIGRGEYKLRGPAAYRPAVTDIDAGDAPEEERTTGDGLLLPTGLLCRCASGTEAGSR